MAGSVQRTWNKKIMEKQLKQMLRCTDTDSRSESRAEAGWRRLSGLCLLEMCISARCDKSGLDAAEKRGQNGAACSFSSADIYC